MKKRVKKVISIIGVIVAIVFAITCGVYFVFLHRYSGKNIEYAWSMSDAFEINQIGTVTKQKDKEFVILNLADVQMCDLEDFFHMRTIYNELLYLVRETKPDLITLTGDQTWSNENLISLTTLIGWLDSFKIPYAPVFGNHDYGNELNSAVASEQFCCDLYEQGKYSLFKRGPSNLGSLGNYVVNIVEDGQIYKTLYMINSGYEDTISDEQIQWVKWNAEGIKSYNHGEYADGVCFLHKPLPEYELAFENYILGDNSVEAVGDVNVHYSLFGSQQNGFFEQAKNIGVTDIVCGHQHGNNFTLKYQGIRLTFALKTGELGGYYEDDKVYLNGATTIAFNNNATTIDSHFVERNKFHI
ncbi:MAG: metallophosphoesterase [Clostridia bacterium]|nr:metallophosphoesterase [Clostridia bacterium]